MFYYFKVGEDLINTSRFKDVTSTTLEETLSGNKLKVSVVSNNEHVPVCLYNESGEKFIIKSPSLTIEVILKSLYGKSVLDVKSLLRLKDNEAIPLLTRLYNVLDNEAIISRNKISHLVHYKELLHDYIDELEAINS